MTFRKLFARSERGTLAEDLGLLAEGTRGGSTAFLCFVSGSHCPFSSEGYISANRSFPRMRQGSVALPSLPPSEALGIHPPPLTLQLDDDLVKRPHRPVGIQEEIEGSKKKSVVYEDFNSTSTKGEYSGMRMKNDLSRDNDRKNTQTRNHEMQDSKSKAAKNMTPGSPNDMIEKKKSELKVEDPKRVKGMSKSSLVSLNGSSEADRQSPLPNHDGRCHKQSINRSREIESDGGWESVRDEKQDKERGPEREIMRLELSELDRERELARTLEREGVWLDQGEQDREVEQEGVRNMIPHVGHTVVLHLHQ